MSVSSPTLRTLAGRFLIALVVGSLLMAGAVAGVNEEIGNKIDNIPKLELRTAPPRPGGANYLLIGSDDREFVSSDLEEEAFGDAQTEKGRNSDTIMVVHVEPKAERTFVLSFPRDLLVNIEGHGRGKLNSAYGFGETAKEGAQILIDTLKTNFDIDIQHFLKLDFKTFVGLVNELGTVSVYVPYPARDEFTGLDLPKPGCVSLDGETSLQYVRSRSLEYEIGFPGNWVELGSDAPDIHRIKRQQDFMRLLAGLAVSRSLANPFTANIVATEVVNGLTADDAFDRGSVYSLIDSFRTLNPQDQSALEFATLPSNVGAPYNGLSVLYVANDDPVTAEYLERLRTFDEKPRPTPAPSTIRVRVVNASGRANLGIAVTEELQRLGFVTVDPVEKTGVRDTGADIRVSIDQGLKGKLLLRYIEPTAQLTLVDRDPDVDVTIVLGKAFETLIEPADAASVTTTTVAPEGAEATPPAGEEPVAAPPVATPTTLAPSFPPEAPRGNC